MQSSEDTLRKEVEELRTQVANLLSEDNTKRKNDKGIDKMESVQQPPPIDHQPPHINKHCEDILWDSDENEECAYLAYQGQRGRQHASNNFRGYDKSYQDGRKYSHPTYDRRNANSSQCYEARAMKSKPAHCTTDGMMIKTTAAAISKTMVDVMINAMNHTMINATHHVMTNDMTNTMIKTL